MSNFVTDVPGANGDYFAAGEYANAKAILIELIRIDRSVPTKWDPRDEAVANLTIFNTADMLNGDEAPIKLNASRITYKPLVSDLNGLEGKMCIFKLHEFTAKNGKFSYAWRRVDPAIADQVIAYAEGLDSQPAADADEVMPDFT